MKQSRTQKIIVVGATGLIGTQVVAQLSLGDRVPGYEVMGVTHETEPGLDLTSPPSIRRFMDTVHGFDHLVVTAGDARFGGFDALDAAAFEVGLRSKLMGQVNVAMAALQVLPPGGSVTLTSGQLAHTPIPGSAAVAMVNGAIESFVRAIALDAPAGRRINAVSPGWIKETMVRMGMDPGPGTSAWDVARLYLEAVEGEMSGEVIEA